MVSAACTGRTAVRERLTCNKAVQSNAECGSVYNQFQPDEPIAAAVKLYVDVLLCVLNVVSCTRGSIREKQASVSC